MLVNYKPFVATLLEEHGPAAFGVLNGIVLLHRVALPGGYAPGEVVAHQMGLSVRRQNDLEGLIVLIFLADALIVRSPTLVFHGRNIVKNELRILRIIRGGRVWIQAVPGA